MCLWMEVKQEFSFCSMFYTFKSVKHDFIYCIMYLNICYRKHCAMKSVVFHCRNRNKCLMTPLTPHCRATCRWYPVFRPHRWHPWHGVQRAKISRITTANLASTGRKQLLLVSRWTEVYRGKKAKNFFGIHVQKCENRATCACIDLLYV